MPARARFRGRSGPQRQRQNHVVSGAHGATVLRGERPAVRPRSARPRRATTTGLLGYLPQRGSLGFAIAVRELVVMGRYRHQGLLSACSSDYYALADAALVRAGMAHLTARAFTQLSGGEQQLVWLAQLSLQDA